MIKRVLIVFVARFTHYLSSFTFQQPYEPIWRLRLLQLENYRIVGAEGHPGECIIKAATLEKPTMIVMGSRGLGPIARTVLGSVSHYVMSHADVPVLIYKTKRSRTYLQPPESFIESI